MQVYVNGVGLLGPGLAGWTESRAIFAGEHPYRNTPPQIPNASLLPPNERRRSSDMVRWAMHVGQEAMQHAQADAREVATVFASSCGEMGVLDRLCTSLATSQRLVSPTLFHHSVHNAAAGYWGIATGSHQSSTALSCYNSSFCGGLLEAATFVSVNDSQVLLVAYDLPAPFPLSEARPLTDGFAVALVLAPGLSRESVSQLTLSLSSDQAEQATAMGEEGLERLRIGNPAARALPLLAALAKDRVSTVCVEYQEDQRVVSRMTPCR